MDTIVNPATDAQAVLMGLDDDPIAAYSRSGYAQRIAAERVGGAQAGWGA
jgi:L-rhamnose isomerase/sugar isomerase